MTVVLIVIGLILIMACPNTVTSGGNTYNLDLIGRIVFWVGAIPTIFVVLIWLLALIGVGVSVPWRTGKRR